MSASQPKDLFKDDEERRKAEAVIEDIRSELGVSESVIALIKDSPGIARAWAKREVLVKNTVHLATAIYSEDARFVKEMIQNADDCQYEANVTPTLQFHLSENNLNIDSNEVGFSEANTRALCTACESNKTNDQIGEKGIGFKSVFRIASKVHVSSRAYSFSFDSKGELGMIVPQWNHVPIRHTSADRTQFGCEIRERYDRKKLAAELLSLELPILMFLRRLRVINISTSTRSRVLRRVDELDGSKVCLTATEEGSLKTSPNPATLTCLLFSFPLTLTISKSGDHANSQTEVKLAFPVDNLLNPLEERQRLFAFLPIKHTGFKVCLMRLPHILTARKLISWQFIVQADFILTPNRQDIVGDHVWNEILLSCLQSLFLRVVHDFISLPKYQNLRYLWVRYLPENVQESFEAIETSIVRCLKQEKVLYSDGGTLETPLSLSYLAIDCRDREGKLFVGDPHTVLGTAYHVSDIPRLQRLGVRQASAREVVQELHKQPQNFFASKSLEWHEDLAGFLLRNPSLVPDIRVLPIFPTITGEWCCAEDQKTQPIYIQPALDSFLPTRLPVHFISEQAVRSPHRKSLCRWLGLNEVTALEVTKQIFQLHSSPYGIPNYQVSDFISDAKYLWHHPYASAVYPSHQLWFATMNMTQALSTSTLYGAFPENRQDLPTLLKGSSGPHNFIHEDYLSAVPKEQAAEWFQWLRTRGVRSILCLTRDETLSAEFGYVRDRQSSQLLLRMLIQDWSVYKPLCSPKIVQALSNSLVACEDGERRQMSTTVLDSPWTHGVLRDVTWPIPSITLDQDLDRQATEDCCKTLGVATTADLKFFKNLLDGLFFWETEKKVNDLLGNVRLIYQHLAAASLSEPDRATIQEVFKKSQLICVGHNATRKIPSQCVWEGPFYLQSKTPLKMLFPKAEKLFKELLQIPNYDITDLVADLTALSETEAPIEDVELVTTMLYDINYQLLSANSVTPGTLLEKKFFPVLIPGETKVHFLSTKDAFFIGDQQLLRQAFDGKIPMLDFSVTEVNELSNLIEWLGLQKKLLTNAVKEEKICSGDCVISSKLTAELRRKGHALYQLLLFCGIDNDQLEGKLQNIRAFHVSEVEILLKIQSQDCTWTEKRNCRAHVFEKDVFEVYCVENQPFDFDTVVEIAVDLIGQLGFQAAGPGILLMSILSSPSEEHLSALMDEWHIWQYPHLAEVDGDEKWTSHEVLVEAWSTDGKTDTLDSEGEAEVAGRALLKPSSRRPQTPVFQTEAVLSTVGEEEGVNKDFDNKFSRIDKSSELNLQPKALMEQVDQSPTTQSL